jgi:MFS transporter, DHA3 family, macrolide efflux protein
MHSLALIWLMNLMTAGSALWMSMIAVMQIVPKILFGPFIGVLVDRWPKLLTMRIVDLTSAVLTGTIALLAFSQTLQPWELLVLTFLLSTASNFFNPAKQMLMTHIVSKEQLMAANSISQTIMTL